MVMGITQKKHLVFFCIYLLIVPGCFIPIDTSHDSNKNEDNNIEVNDANLNSNVDILSKFNIIDYKIDSINNLISNNQNQIEKLNDSLMIFQQLDLSIDTSEDDIINSLIRIQSKLNVVEEKLFVYDSLYFNTLNELIRIEDMITVLANPNQGAHRDIDSINDNSQQYDFDKRYKNGYELYKEEKFDEAIIIFREIITLNPSYINADNSQFWIGQIYFIKKEYEFAIIEYEKVFSLGDKNKTPDAEYKIAISYKIMGDNDTAKKRFDDIIQKYPNNNTLVTKSQKELKNIN